MVTLNQPLLRLVRDDLIEPHEAYLKAVDKHGLRKLFKSKQITYDP
jgi:Tfp pilus assembly ATPase PilU